MVAKCSYAFSFAAETFDEFFLESSVNPPEMVSFEADNGAASPPPNSSCVPSSNNCVALNNGCLAVSSCNTITARGCLLASSSSSCSSSVSSSFHLTTSSFASSSCRSGASAVSSVPCIEKSKDATDVKEESAIDDAKSCATDLSMIRAEEDPGSCKGTDGALSELSLVDIKLENDLTTATENSSKTVKYEMNSLVSADYLATAAGKDRPSDDPADREGSGGSQWGDPPVLDNSVLWDSPAEPKETGADRENPSKTSAEARPLICKGAVLWDKPPSLIKMEQQGAAEAKKPAGGQPGSRRWMAINCIGAGLQNLGNTCFVNATLQCLTYTPPLVNYLLAENNNTSCRVAGLCLMCELGRHMTQCFQNSGGVIKPHSILQKLKVIAKHMRWGRQEDAHEFLRYMVDAMNKSCINGHQVSLDNSKETIVNKIFGGYLCSQVTCKQCKAESNTYDPFLDLSLDVKNVPSILIALQKFVQPETLDIDNAYNCTKCEQKVCAQKRFTIHRLSNILTIQLKRYGVMGGKVTRHIAFPELLDLRPFMSKVNAGALLYQLYGVLVHDGHSTNSGHYYCYVMTAKGDWYCMNDHMVRRSSLSQVLNAEAYLLLYIRQPSSSSGSSDSISLSNSSPDGNSPIHRGAVIGDGQQMDAIIKDDIRISKERVMCRGGQLPMSCKKGLVACKKKSILAGSKLPYTKSMQHKVKHLVISPNFSVEKHKKKTSTTSTKKQKKTLLLSHSLLKETLNKAGNHGAASDNQSLTIGPDLVEKTCVTMSDSSNVENKEKIFSSKDKPANLEKHEVLFKNRLKLDEQQNQISDSKGIDGLAVNCDVSKAPKSLSVSSKPKTASKPSAGSQISRQNVAQQKSKRNSPETSQSESAGLHLTDENSRCLLSAVDGASLSRTLPKSAKQSTVCKNRVANRKCKNNRNHVGDVPDHATGPQNVKSKIEQQFNPKGSSAVVDNRVGKGVVASTASEDSTAVESHSHQREKTNCTLPRIVLKIKKGQAMLEGSLHEKVVDLACSENVKVSEEAADLRSAGILATGKKAKASGIQRLETKVGKFSKSMLPEKQALQKGKNGCMGQTATAKKPFRHSRLLFAVNRKGLKGLRDETGGPVSRNAKRDVPKDAPSRGTLKSSCDVYDFSGESDCENVICEISTRRSPKTSLLKSIGGNSHCTPTDGELSATTIVPGSNIPLDRSPRAFCPRSHQSEKRPDPEQKCLASPVSGVADNARTAPFKNLSAADSRSLLALSGCSARSELSYPESGMRSAPVKALHRSKAATSAIPPKRLCLSFDKNHLEMPKSNTGGNQRNSLQGASKSWSCESIRRNSQPDSGQSILSADGGPSSKRRGSKGEHSNLDNSLNDISCGPCHNTEVNDLGSGKNLTSIVQQCDGSKVSVKIASGPDTEARKPASDDSMSSVSRFHNGTIGRRKILRQDHRKCEKRRSLCEDTVSETSKARVSLKRKAKFSGTYSEAEMHRVVEIPRDPLDAGAEISSLPPISGGLALTSIKLKIRKVSTGEDGQNIYEIVPNTADHLTAPSVLQRSTSSHQCCSLSDAGLSDCSMSAIDNLHSFDTCHASNGSSTGTGHAKSPFSGQAREQRNIFQNLEEAVMHSREEFTRQTGLGWSKADENGDAPQTDADGKNRASFKQQDFSILNGFNWTSFLNHSVPNDSGPT